MVMRFGKKDKNENMKRVESGHESEQIMQPQIVNVPDNYRMSFDDFLEVASGNDWDLIAKTYETQLKFYWYFITPEGALVKAGFWDGDLFSIETHTNDGYNYRRQ